jgi:hypothetical protein
MVDYHDLMTLDYIRRENIIPRCIGCNKFLECYFERSEDTGWVNMCCFQCKQIQIEHDNDLIDGDCKYCKEYYKENHEGVTDNDPVMRRKIIS